MTWDVCSVAARCGFCLYLLPRENETCPERAGAAAPRLIVLWRFGIARLKCLSTPPRQPSKKGVHVVKTLFAQLGRYRKDALLTPVFVCGEVLMEVLIPFVMAYIIDRGIMAGDMGQVVRYSAVMLVMAFASLAFGALAGRFSSVAAAGFACNLRDSMYGNIQAFSFSNIDKYSTAGLVTRMTTDVTNVQNAFQMLLRIASRAPLTLICSLVMCFIISPSLSMVFLAALVVLALALGIIMASTFPVFQKVFARYDDLNASVQEDVSAIRVVKAFVREDYENEKFRAAAHALRKLYTKAEGLLALNSPVMMLAVYGCIIALSWLGAQQVVGGALSTGNLTSLFSYIMSVLMSLMMLSMVFVMVAMSLASMRRIVEVIEERADIADPERPVTCVADGSIRFNHVDFSYKHGSGERVLEDIDLTIDSGETIGIVGGTGSGKSSLVSLISRLYDVDEGAVLVGGRDVRAYDTRVLRDEVAVVLQNNVLFSGTILENLRWGKADATREECEAALRAACADEFVERLPEGLDTRIEQGGTNVSGGQRQRLCIARALLKNPKVIIFDDSTSAVDTATDAKIRTALNKHIPGTTKIIIAQRIASVGDADRVIVLDDGRVVGFDTPERLLKTNAIYREIYEMQTGGDGVDFDEGAAESPAGAPRGGERA